MFCIKCVFENLAKFTGKHLRWSLFINKTVLAGMDASQMHLWDVSCSVSETSQRGLICKSRRRLRWDVLKTSPRRRLWDLLGLLRDVSELHLRVYRYFQIEAFFGYLLIYFCVFIIFCQSNIKSFSEFGLSQKIIRVIYITEKPL